MMRTLPMHAQPATVKVGSSPPAHAKAYLQHLSDTGDPAPLTTAKAVAKESDSSFGTTLGTVLEIGGALLAAVL